MQDFYTLTSDRCSLVLDCRHNTPAVLYWGARLTETTAPQMLALLATRQEARANVEKEAPLALSPETGAGFVGDAGIQVHRDARQWAVYSQLEDVEHEQPGHIVFRARCDHTAIRIIHELQLDNDSDVLRIRTTIENTGDSALSVERCHAACIPLPPHFDRITGFAGRWAGEFRRQTVTRFQGTYLRENRAGRTSHDAFPGILIHTPETNESMGAAYALHLAWSGNHRIRVDEFSGGRACTQLGELFFPAEITLAPGETYSSPSLYGVFSENGFNGVSRGFHRYVRTQLADSRVAGKARPVHFNTWEAVYFDHSIERLTALADSAANVGVERFVLDDGWFRNRRSDDAGLGDWYVDKDRYPDGLSPLADHVNGLGMEFGLWVEPEMVNPDSDLYRAHPDWVLNADPAPRLLERNQLVLDLSRNEVCEYLFERMDALLTEYPITYLKWDMNRSLSQPGGQDGRAATHRQTRALYALLSRIRSAHPKVEIESCASGGGRADFGVLAHTDRIWTSDSNDPLDRLDIQKGFSVFFPAEVMGAHVGPSTCHITGRTSTMAFRCAVAFFGNMGIEANLLDLDADELDELGAAIALHKAHRDLIFSGDLYRLDMHPGEIGFGIVSGTKDEALFAYALVHSLPQSAPGRFFFHGLAPDIEYRIETLWPRGQRSYSESILDVIGDQPVTGAALVSAGMQLPILDPESMLILRLCRAE